MKWEVPPCLILVFVFRRGVPNSFSWSSGYLGQVGSLFVRRSHFRIASSSSWVWWIFLFHWTASRLKHSLRILFPGFNKLFPSQLYNYRYLIIFTWNFYQREKKISFPFHSAEMSYFKLLDTELRFFQRSAYTHVYQYPSLERLL